MAASFEVLPSWREVMNTMHNADHRGHNGTNTQTGTLTRNIPAPASKSLYQNLSSYKRRFPLLPLPLQKVTAFLWKVHEQNKSEIAVGVDNRSLAPCMGTNCYFLRLFSSLSIAAPTRLWLPCKFDGDFEFSISRLAFSASFNCTQPVEEFPRWASWANNHKKLPADLTSSHGV